ncbi:hypothetical protein HMPREF9306_01165 [Propionimicrobium lymphophilum ACS-093-V-SCH5]|uniref:Uncharacterized protein n=1 Tax=Propionimicrobium lymphophilum ACS-093-V-SCH5 TaxID=883161 RepID=S2WJN5_9ACTN|nr:hypothetical protein [Propionimicrobium lymphophilum]EPD32857.1 hypothetical protein HMPREF9306_01165 [Propionimicrobium lymphophilum ACS-093-V-SCH5]
MSDLSKPYVPKRAALPTKRRFHTPVTLIAVIISAMCGSASAFGAWHVVKPQEQTLRLPSGCPSHNQPITAPFTLTQDGQAWNVDVVADAASLQENKMGMIPSRPDTIYAASDPGWQPDSIVEAVDDSGAKSCWIWKPDSGFPGLRLEVGSSGVGKLADPPTYK